MSGLAFCALIHRYRPDLIGDFGQLDFSGTNQSYKSNLTVAFDAAGSLGVPRLVRCSFVSSFRTLDESVMVTLPDKTHVQKFLIALRHSLEGTPELGGSVPYRPLASETSDHRISTIFSYSSEEADVVADFERLKKSRKSQVSFFLHFFGFPPV